MEPMKLLREFAEKCAKPLAFALRPGGKGPRAHGNASSEGPDPITCWVKGLLREEPEDSA
jgi:hypothetical protein